MKAVVQRVKEARVAVDGAVIGACGEGVMILICAMQGDTDANAKTMASKISKLRIFRDDDGRMNRSLLDVGGGALVVSQFTLSADTSRGNRPGFSAAAPPEEGRRLYELFCAELSGLGVAVETGAFGADMAVHLINDGPVTIPLDF